MVKGWRNWLGYRRLRQPGGVVELVYYTGPAEFLQRAMQPQLFWGTNNRMPLQPTHRGRIDRLRRDCRDSCTPSLRRVAVHNTPHNSRMSLAVFTVPARALLVLLSR